MAACGSLIDTKYVSEAVNKIRYMYSIKHETSLSKSSLRAIINESVPYIPLHPLNS